MNAANQASTDANAALQQAQGNVSQINGLDARVKVLEDESIKTFTQTLRLMSLGATGINQSSQVVLNPYIKNIHMSGGAGSGASLVFTIVGKMELQTLQFHMLLILTFLRSILILKI